jgi:hypothetical protein
MSMPTLEEIVQAIEGQIASEGSALLRRVLAADPNFVRRIAEAKLGPTLRAPEARPAQDALLARTEVGRDATRRAMGTHLGRSIYLRRRPDGLVRLEIQFEDQVFRSREAKTIEAWAPAWSALKRGAKDRDTFDHHEVGDAFGIYWLSVDKDGNEYDPYADEATSAPSEDDDRNVASSLDAGKSRLTGNVYRVATMQRNGEDTLIPDAGDRLDFSDKKRALDHAQDMAKKHQARILVIFMRFNDKLMSHRELHAVVDPKRSTVPAGLPATMLVGSSVSNADAMAANARASQSAERAAQESRAAYQEAMDRLEQVDKRDLEQVNAFLSWWRTHQRIIRVDPWAGYSGQIAQDATAQLRSEGAVWTLDDTLRLPRAAPAARLPQNDVIKHRADRVIPALRLWFDLSRAEEVVAAQAEGGRVDAAARTMEERAVRAWTALPEPLRDAAIELDHLLTLISPNWSDDVMIARVARIQVAIARIRPTDPKVVLPSDARFMTELRHIMDAESVDDVSPRSVAAEIRRGSLAWFVDPDVGDEAREDGGGAPELAPAAPANAVRVVLNDKGFLVENTERSHADRIKAINAPGRWMWSRALSAWYLLRVGGERAWSAAPDVVRQLNAAGIPAVLVDERDGAAPLSDQDSPPRPATPVPSAPTRAPRPPKPPKRKKVDMKALPDAPVVPVSSDLIGTWVWTGNASGTFWLSPLEAGKSKGSLTVTGERTIAESSVMKTRYTAPRGTRGLYRRGKEHDPDADGVVRDALVDRGDVIDGTPAGWKLSADGEWSPYAQQSIVELSTLKKLQLVGGPVARFLARCWGLTPSERILFWANRRLVDVTRPGVEIEVQDNEPVVVIGSDVELREIPDKPEGPTGTVRVGDHFIRTFLGDASVYSFYEVVRVSPSGKTVDLRGVQKQITGESETSYGRAFPIPGAFTSTHVETVRVRFDDDGTPSYAGRMRYVRPGEGHPHYPYGM